MSASLQNSFCSQRSDDFFDETENNLANLSSIQLYLPYQISSFSCYNELRDSLGFAKQFITSLLKQTHDVAYEKQLNSRQNQYSVISCLLLGERQIEGGIQECDVYDQKSQIPIELLDDTEPKRPNGERWLRSKVIIERPREIKKAEDSPSYNHESLRSLSELTSQASLNKLRVVKKKEDYKGKIPEPQSIEVPLEADEYIERLRQMKQIEQKRKEAKDEYNKKQNQNPSELKKEMKSIKYTYDFDGKIINTKPVKIEKLPPSSYSIPYNFSTSEIDKNKNLKKTEELLKIQQQTLNKKQIGQQIQREEYGLGTTFKQIPSKNPFNFDDFSPSTGVTIIYESKQKEGRRGNEIFDSLEVLEQRLRLHDSPLHITRTEYKRLIENGNLNRTQALKIMEDTIQKRRQSLNIEELTKRNISFHSSKEDAVSIIKQDMKRPTQQDLSHDYNKEGKQIAQQQEQQQKPQQQQNQLPSQQKQEQQQAKSSDGSKSKIRIIQSRLVKQVILPDDEELGLKSPTKNKNQLPTIEFTQRDKSPVDDFNQSILKEGQEWGKGKVATTSYFYKGKTLHKPSLKVLQTTLNQFYKLPRERDLGSSFKLSKSTNQSAAKISKTEISQLNSTSDIDSRSTFYNFNPKFSDSLRHNLKG